MAHFYCLNRRNRGKVGERTIREPEKKGVHLLGFPLLRMSLRIFLAADMLSLSTIWWQSGKIVADKEYLQSSF